uniref:Bridge-like lipid transfer protein family member 1 N-terminal domain-containing protein n=1 Tax=Plectus sambesii TaxID=2011161 RepID=A0A914VDP2_9BILA
MTSFLDSFLSMAWNKTAALTSTSKEERNSSDDEVIVDWDTTNPQQFWLILLSLTLLITWLVFIAFYLSRVAGPVVAFVINRYLRWIGAQGRLSFGSFSLSVLGGKIMFRNAAYICDDFTLRCNDGWLIFSYWRCYGGKKLGVDDLSSESVRLHLSLNGLEFHVYNQLVYYERLARIYGLGRLLPPTDIDEKDVRTQLTPRQQRQAEQWTASLLSLLAKVRCDISSGRFVAGNSLLPTSFVVSFENTALTMTTRPPSNALAGDRFMLVVHGVTENFRAGFVKTPDYRADNCTRTERYDEPPRTMGDGFAVLQTASLEFYYNQDILGQVNEKEGVQKLDSCVPIWESIWRLGKNTVISYGPWADKQRTLLYNLFYPPEYRLVAVTELPKAGEQRTLIRHEMRISTLHDAAIDIWFMREDEVNAIHAGIKQGSNFEVSIPWLTLEDGFTSTIKGSLLRVDASTSLSYRQLIECESFEFDVICRFPRGWNAHQRWDYNFRISKMTAWLVWDHKLFLQDLFNEWAGEDPPDMCTFIPWTWKFSFVVQDFEVILAMNDQNWIDTSSSQTAENCLAAIFGRKIEIGFDLPFGEFFPEKIAMRFELYGSDGLGLGLWLPPQHTMRPVLQCLDSAAVISRRKRASLPTNSRPMWRSATEANGWSDIWSTQSATLVFKYTFHQIPNLPRSDIPPDSVTKWSPPPITSPDQLAADHLSVEVDIGPSQVRLSGLIVKLIFIFKENYFGLFENLTDITSLDEQSVKMAYGPVEPGDLARCRPFHVTVSLMLHNVEGHCLMHTPHRDSPMGAQVGDPCPVVFLEQLALEIDKRHSETILQVGLSPAVVHFSDRDHPDGHLSLSALQFRGHGMFSSIDVPLSAPTVEYGWLMDIVLGDLDGRLHPGQLITLVEFLDTFLFMILSKEEQLATPKVFDLCQHMSPVSLCDREPQAACLSEHHLKYEFIRFAMDSLHLIVMEDMAALELNAKSARLATCNAHASVVSQNVSVMLPLLQVRQFVACDMTKFTGWLECGSVRLADTKIDLSIPVKSTPDRLERRKAFLRKHDLRTKRLRFLWNDQDGRCGCTGGCRFFADDDVFGRQFFVRKSDKLAVVKIVESSTEQLGFGQSIFRKDQRLVSSTLPTDTKEMRSSVSVEMSVDDKYFETSQLDATEEDAASLTPSDVSFHSAHEDTNVNLYSHINCPVLTSDILMGNYAKYLNHFSARPLNGALKTPSFGGASIAKWLCENHFEFVQTRAGINAINLSEDTADHKRSVGGEQRMKKLEGRHDTVEVIGSISDGVELFVSPLSVECLQRLISSSAFALNAIHPAYIVQRLHADCSLRCHRQPLVVPPSATPASDSNRFPPLQIFFVLPTVRCAVFQCGLVEKTIPYSRIEQADQLVQANVLVTISEQFRVMAATVSKKTDGSILMMPAKAETRRTHAQFLQIVSSQSTNIGIGKNVADSNFVTNWKDLSPICHQFELRQVVDAEVPEVSATLTLKNRIVAANSNVSQPPEPPPTAARESNREPPEGATIFTPREEQDEVVVKIGPLSVIFGLCQPVDSSSDNRWPLFDMLAPSISAWIHVVHRLTQSTGKVADSLSEWRQLTLAKLLTDALQCDDDRVFMPPKSSFAPAKGFGKYLRGCPSCQVLLTLLRYCSAIGVEDDYETTTMHCGELLHDARLRRKALVVLLSHWQTVVCANKDVTLLDPSLAEKFKGSRFEYGDEDTEKSTPPPDVRITIEPESTSGDVSKDGAKKAAKSEKADKVDGDRLADRRISSASKRSIESLTRPKNIRRANAGGSLSSSPRSTL